MEAARQPPSVLSERLALFEYYRTIFHLEARLQLESISSPLVRLRNDRSGLGLSEHDRLRLLASTISCWNTVQDISSQQISSHSLSSNSMTRTPRRRRERQMSSENSRSPLKTRSLDQRVPERQRTQLASKFPSISEALGTLESDFNPQEKASFLRTQSNPVFRSNIANSSHRKSPAVSR
jgi:hypothetical protein